MKIVLAVDEDKKTIVKRTGQSAYFSIYDDDKFVEVVPNKHHDGGHHSHRENEDHWKSIYRQMKYGIEKDNVPGIRQGLSQIDSISTIHGNDVFQK